MPPVGVELDLSVVPRRLQRRLVGAVDSRCHDDYQLNAVHCVGVVLRAVHGVCLFVCHTRTTTSHLTRPSPGNSVPP